MNVYNRVVKVNILKHLVVVVQSCLTLCDPMKAHQASLSFTVSWSLFRFMSTESVMLSNNPILYYPLLLPSIFPSVRVFANELTLHIMWPNYRSFRFSISPSNEYLGLISFRIDWFDLLAVQRFSRCLLQYRNSKASVLWCSAFFMVQFSHLYMTIGKTIALTKWAFVGTVMRLLFNTQSTFVIASLPRSKCFLTSWLQSQSAVTLEPKKVKHLITFTFSSSICHEVMGLDAMILIFCITLFRKPLFYNRVVCQPLDHSIKVKLKEY